MRKIITLALLLATTFGAFAQAKKPATKPTTNSTTAQIIFQGTFPQHRPEKEEPKLIYSANIKSEVIVKAKEFTQSNEVKLKVVQGKMKETVFALGGRSDIYSVVAGDLAHWSIRKDAKGNRQLVLIPTEKKWTQKDWNVRIFSRQKYTKIPTTISPLVLTPQGSAMFDGTINVKREPNIKLVPYSVKNLQTLKSKDNELDYRFSGSAWTLLIEAKEDDPELRVVRLESFELTGSVVGDTASFKLSGTAIVRHPEGGTLSLLSGPVALTDYQEEENAKLEYLLGNYRMKFATNGEFPVALEFNAQISDSNNWKNISFAPVSAPLREVTITGLTKETQVHFVGAAEAKWVGKDYVSFLPTGGSLNLRWQEVKKEEEGKLFYSVSGLGQITVSPGMVRQMTVLDYKVMQGEFRELNLTLEGNGSITRVEGANILGWTSSVGGGKGTINVKLNQAQKGDYQLTVHTQAPLGAFPMKIEPVRVLPVDAIRYGGYLRVVSQGAVRLEVLNAPGLAQISPTRFPQTKALPGLSAKQLEQAFAFRFSGPQFGLEIQADNILPELAVSQLLIYKLGETEIQIDAELELDIREAPLREFTMTIPDGYTIAQLNVPNYGDHNVIAGTNGGPATLRIQFSQPLFNRQVANLRLTKNHDSPPTNWTLPKVAPNDVKSLRGFVGVSADAGLRLSEGSVSELTEIATAFFPKKIAELQLAYRLRDENWTATVNSERLELSVQADTLHLFSLGQGIAYGSSLFNYAISGAPVSVLRFEAPANYSNLEFVGNEIRNWNKTTNGYEIHLHTPISGTYSLVATYDMKFKSGEDEVSFEGLAPQGVQSEQGYVVVVSSHQFKTEEVNVSAGLISLEKGEVPVEYRLLLDAPMLAAYQYTTRPFVARLKLTSLGQGKTVDQVVDRAVIKTRISSEGNALTDITYLVKSKGHAHLRITVPGDAELWSAHVRGAKVVPRMDQAAHLIPLPQNVVPNTIIPVNLKIAAKATDARKIHLALPILATPVLLAEWHVNPDTGHRLEYQDGVLAPQDDPIDVSGFAWLTNTINGWQGRDEQAWCWIIGVLLLVGSLVWHWATSDGTYRMGWKNGIFGLVGAAAVLTAMGALGWLASEADGGDIVHREAVRFMIPVQAEGTALSVDLANIPTDEKGAGVFSGWPILLGLAMWFYMFLEQRGITRRLGVAFGWMLVFWGCLRMDHGARGFFIVAILFVVVHVAIPLIVRQSRLPKRPKPPKADPPGDEPDEPESPSGSAAGATAVLIAGLFLSGADAEAAKRVVQQKLPAKPEIVMNSLNQTATVKGNQVYVSANGEWRAEAGQSIDFLRQPAVLKKVRLPEGKVKLTEANVNRRNVYRLTAISNGTYRISFDYEVGVSVQRNVRGFNLPTHYGLVNRVTLNLDRAGQDIVTTSAVSVEPAGDKDGSKFELVMSPTIDARIGWKPRSRDVRNEQVIFYTEQRQLFIPAAGVIEGIHEAKVQAARGQLTDLTFSTPEEMTITDVACQALKAWRFDPDTKKLRLQFETPQTGPFHVRVTSQFTGGTLPFEREIGLLRIDGASSQIGQVGVATGSEVVLEKVEAPKFTRINLEDFPAALVANEQKRITGLTLRRAFRYSNLIKDETLKLSASAVQPDIRVGSSQTLSLGEDRTVLSVRLNANITRAGVFKLSFVMPENLDVDSITGNSLSHWTGLKSDTNRIVTLHLKGKTLGAQQFNLSLVGPGPTTTNAWATPRISIREANKENGQLVVVPEQGMRLHVAERNGLTQLDPKKNGITQRGVLVFNLLHADWKLGFNIEKVDPWIQVTSLQDVTVREGQLKVNAWLDYKIENAGVKTLSVEVPAGADAVQFTGDHVSDFVRGAVQTNVWEIKLQRRVIGDYRLNVTWQANLANEQVVANVSGLRPLRSDLHRGFLSLRTSGRLDVRFPNRPASLQIVDWQSIPANLRGLAGNEANHAFRALEQDYQLDVNVVRHDAAQLLPARVESVELSSTLSDSGMLLTSVRLMIHPGDMRSLRFKIPTDSFWFATVNHASVRPWMEGDQILLPLEQNTKPNEAVPVEFLYSIQTKNEKQLRNLVMNGPQFDLPLENIVWHVFIPPTWELDDWKTKLQIHDQAGAHVPLQLDLQTYVQEESEARQEKTKEAEQQLAIGNQFLAEGRQKQARQAFRNAWSLSQHDNAFNEDARVQLRKLKMQQAVVGLNFRRHSNQKMIDAEAAQKPNASLQILQSGQEAYTQEQVRQALRDNDPAGNAVLMTLAENLVEQQDAAQAVPEAIRASVPKQGNIYTFTRSIQVDKWADLSVQLQTSVHQPSSTSGRAAILGVLFLASLIYMFAAKRRPEL